ncbi:restriction endonuclease [Neisseria gonorrhoeae]|uniref:Restriction endonuclease n=1 Tax=Neisseria gonorrhoeae TaxID=485 RepID=A0A378W4M4_NEIGO|nr:restriction endonuclease [Neisseria gonorrhoeae]
MSNNQPNSQIYEDYWAFTNAFTNYNDQKFVLHSIFVLTLLMRIKTSHTATNYMKHCSKHCPRFRYGFAENKQGHEFGLGS